MGIKDVVPAAGLVAIALLCYMLGRYHETWIKPFSYVYFAVAAVPLFAAAVSIAALSVTCVYSTRSGLLLIARVTGEANSALDSSPIAVVLCLLCAAVIAFAAFGVFKQTIRKWEGVLVIAAAALSFALAVLPGKIFVADPSLPGGIGRGITGAGVAYAILVNLFILLGLLTVLLVGYLYKKAWVINLGVLLLISFVIVKYFDWFFRLGTRAYFFIGAGLLFIAVGLLMEKGRRCMLASMQGSEANYG